MNTKIAHIIGALLFSVIAIACVSPIFADLAIIGENGQVLLYSLSGGTGILTTAVEWLPHRRPITESYFASSEKKLFVSDDTGKLYELDFSACSNGYERIDTGKDHVSCSVWYDVKEKRPAWLHVMDQESATHVRFQGKDNIICRSQPDDVLFKKRHVFGMHIDGHKPTTFLIEKHPELAFLSKRYPNDQWIINGRSKNTASYGRIIADITSAGDEFKATVLLHDRKQDKWYVEALNEYCKVTTYDNVAVMRGIYDIKGDKYPNGNQIQGRPSGKWRFFIPRKNLFLSCELNPTWIVQYATSKEALISGSGKVFRLTLTEHEQNKPEVVVNLPAGISVFAVYPL